MVATGVAAVGHDRHRLTSQRYVATFGSGAQAGARTYAAAVALGGDRAAEQVVLGDGAAWIKTQQAQHFPEAVTILDWSHVARAVHKAVRAARPGPERRAERRALHRTIPDHLWHGRVDEAWAALRALRPVGEATEPIKALEEALTYLQEQRPWLGNYQAWQEAGRQLAAGWWSARSPWSSTAA